VSLRTDCRSAEGSRRPCLREEGGKRKVTPGSRKGIYLAEKSSLGTSSASGQGGLNVKSHGDSRETALMSEEKERIKTSRSSKKSKGGIIE